MRAVIQRVSSASVSVDGKTCGLISKGLLILVGFSEGDNREKLVKFVDKICKLRIIADNKGKMNLSVFDSHQEILLVSQFTLYANTEKGNRPSFIKALEPQKAKILYNELVGLVRERGIKTETGMFGEYMDISSRLDGPVTIILDY